jgi:hypothetical protein
VQSLHQSQAAGTGTPATTRIVALSEELFASVGLPSNGDLRREDAGSRHLCFERTLGLSTHPVEVDRPDFAGAFHIYRIFSLLMNFEFHMSNGATLRLECKRCQCAF